MFLIVVLTLALVAACSPSWQNVKHHPNGVCEDVTKGECWDCDGLYPTQCPLDRTP